MRKQPGHAAGVTYVGPRAFAVAFCVVCAVFLAIFFGVGRLTDPVEMAVVESAASVPAAGAANSRSPLPVAVDSPSSLDAAQPSRPRLSVLRRNPRSPLVRALVQPPVLRALAKVATPRAPVRATVARAAVKPAALRAVLKTPAAAHPATVKATQAAAAGKSDDAGAAVRLLLVPFKSAAAHLGTGQLTPDRTARDSLVIAAPPSIPQPSSAASPRP
jgi:hypothetical protein